MVSFNMGQSPNYGRNSNILIPEGRSPNYGRNSNILIPDPSLIHVHNKSYRIYIYSC
jgi:hypothetical protein